MHRLIGAILCACLLACGFGQAARAGQLFVYEGAGCDGRKAVPGFEAAMGRKADGVVDFVNYTADWPGAVSASKWGSWCWAGSGYRLAWSVPLAVAKGANADLASVAAGKANAYFTAIAADLVAQGHADAYIRPGWEFNGGWYPWGGHSAVNVAAAFRQAHDAMAAVPGAKFRFVWNPALYMNGFWPDQAYPGDAYVDVIAVDAYASAWGSTDPGTITAHSVTDATPWNVRGVVAFAKARGKPYAFPEWGTGKGNYSAGDYPGFISAMTPYVAGAEFAGYWDYPASDYDASFAHNPQAAAAVKALYAPAQTIKPAASPTLAAKISGGGTVVVLPNADGSIVLALTFPTTAKAVTYTITPSEPRKLGFANAAGGLSGGLWNGGGAYSAFTWSSSGGTARVYVAPK